jgi:alanine-glyoxylate transaminase/(R)-3-amino-2-methylpropionate-pyruvate transaminase
VCYIVNSGSEANDLALLLARLYTNNFEMLAFQNCYHGGINSTMALTSLSTWKYNYPHQFGIRHVPNPDPYKSLHSSTDGSVSQETLNQKRHDELLNTII